MAGWKFMGRHLRRWGAIYAVAALLLGLSQLLWQWQTWPVRALLQATQLGTTL